VFLRKFGIKINGLLDLVTELEYQPVNNILTLNLPTTTIVAQPFNIIKWQLKFNPVA